MCRSPFISVHRQSSCFIPRHLLTSYRLSLQVASLEIVDLPVLLFPSETWIFAWLDLLLYMNNMSMSTFQFALSHDILYIIYIQSVLLWFCSIFYHAIKCAELPSVTCYVQPTVFDQVAHYDLHISCPESHQARPV